ncbi:MAG: CHAD domain-containing protein, partial [Deltaproteobacteria bacterium]
MAGAQLDKWIPGVSPDDRLIEVARRSLQARLGAVQHFLPLAAATGTEELENIHHLRVWTRRAAAAVKMYAPLLPRRRLAWMEKQLKRLRRAANEARDLDVLVERLTKQCGEGDCGRSMKELREQRAAAQEPLVTIYERLKCDDRFDNRIEKLLQRVRPPRTATGEPEEWRFGDWARNSLRPFVERFFEAAPVDADDVEALHQFRILGKQLRYAMELLAGAFSREFCDRLYPAVETLQDKLGEINDLVTAQARFDRQLKQTDDPAHQEELRKLMSDDQRRLCEARREFLKWCTPQSLEDLWSGFDRILGRPLPGHAPGYGRHVVPAPSPSRSRSGVSREPESDFVDPPVRPTAGKMKIVGELGEAALLLPDSVNEALAANDRAKYLMTLLQTARSHADHPELTVTDLRQERLACDVAEGEFDNVVDQSHRAVGGAYEIPMLPRIHELLTASLREMLAPVQIHAAGATGGPGPVETGYEQRLTDLLAETPSPAANQATGDFIDRIVSVAHNGDETFHRLVMDLHKDLNRIQQEIAGESIDQARVYAVTEPDRRLIAAFMSGVNQTRALKFDHPGLETTATRAGSRLVIQNDIGTTDAHVLVVHVEELQVTMTHTDVHLPRVLFFQSLFAPFAVQWEDTRSRRAAGLEDQLYHLCVGRYAARDEGDLERYLRFLGSRLVFLIDWNRARKRLRKFAPKRVCLEVLKWAADNDMGHRGFLQLGGERLIFDALQVAGRVPLQIGGQLSDLLGADKTAEFLKFTLKTAADGLLAGWSESFIRDEISAELRHYMNTIQQGILATAAEHASLIVELAITARDGLVTAGPAGDRPFLDRAAARARTWEHRADELVIKARTARVQWDAAKAIPELLDIADDAADELEEAIMRLALLPPDQTTAPSFAPLHALAGLLVQGAQEYLKAVENARSVQRGSSRQQIDDFLQAVDRIITIEHQTDDAHRGAQASILTFAGDFKQ